MPEHRPVLVEDRGALKMGDGYVTNACKQLLETTAARAVF
jgi:hypothetical protein